MEIDGMVQEEYKVTISLRNRIATFNIYMLKRERKAKKRLRKHDQGRGKS